MSYTDSFDITNYCLEQFMACDFIIASNIDFFTKNKKFLKGPYIPIFSEPNIEMEILKNPTMNTGVSKSTDKGKASSGTSSDHSDKSINEEETKDNAIILFQTLYSDKGLLNNYIYLRLACELQYFLAYAILFPEVLSQLRKEYSYESFEEINSIKDNDRHKKLAKIIESALGFQVAPDMIETLRGLITNLGKISEENSRHGVSNKDVLRNDVLTHASEENIDKIGSSPREKRILENSLLNKIIPLLFKSTAHLFPIFSSSNISLLHSAWKSLFANTTRSWVIEHLYQEIKNLRANIASSQCDKDHLVYRSDAEDRINYFLVKLLKFDGRDILQELNILNNQPTVDNLLSFLRNIKNNDKDPLDIWKNVRDFRIDFKNLIYWMLSPNPRYSFLALISLDKNRDKLILDSIDSIPEHLKQNSIESDNGIQYPLVFIGRLRTDLEGEQRINLRDILISNERERQLLSEGFRQPGGSRAYYSKIGRSLPW